MSEFCRELQNSLNIKNKKIHKQNITVISKIWKFSRKKNTFGKAIFVSPDIPTKCRQCQTSNISRYIFATLSLGGSLFVASCCDGEVTTIAGFPGLDPGFDATSPGWDPGWDPG